MLPIGLSLSLSLYAMWWWCLWAKRGGGATRSNDAGCISAPPIAHHLLHIKPHNMTTLPFNHTSPNLHVRTWSDQSHLLILREINSTQSFSLFLSVPPPFSLCAGKLIYEPAWLLDFLTDANLQLLRDPAAKRKRRFLIHTENTIFGE